MNAALFVIVFGAILLFIPQTSWMGIAMLGIGAISYTVMQKGPSASYQPSSEYMGFFAPKRLQRAGITMSRRDPLQQGEGDPYIKDGMFNLPLPIDNDVAQFVNVNYATPTGAKGFTQEKEKPGHPFLPGF